jgi:hypothetical protein
VLRACVTHCLVKNAMYLVILKSGRERQAVKVWLEKSVCAQLSSLRRTRKEVVERIVMCLPDGNFAVQM